MATNESSDPAQSLQQIHALIANWHPGATSELEDHKMLMDLALPMARVVSCASEAELVAQADNAYKIFKTIICKWLHTEWVHNTRERTLKEMNWDVFKGIRFDMETETEKLYNQVRTKQIDITTFHRQRTRLLNLYKENPAMIMPEENQAESVDPGAMQTSGEDTDMNTGTPPPEQTAVHHTETGTKKDFDLVYAKYPRYISDNFAKDELERAFAHRKTWPRGPYRKYFRSKGPKMCDSCTARTSTTICVVDNTSNDCLQCVIDNAVCVTTNSPQMGQPVQGGGKDNLQEVIKAKTNTNKSSTGSANSDRLSELPQTDGTSLESTSAAADIHMRGTDAADTIYLLDAVRREKAALRAQRAILLWQVEDLENIERDPSSAI
ncbi:hypothetical protein BDW22DRAFT_1432510 [Trametopsis cervina]|nr:hypothetical protein BDW22DRAFT_1432510 [Trametopsis cervina]